MSFCPKCGAQMEEGQKFCPKCGYSLEGGEQAQTNAGAQQSASSGNSFADGVNSIINDIQNTDDHSAGYAPSDISANKGVSILAYIGILVLIPMLAKKDSPFARFHSNQGLVLFIFEILSNIVCGIVNVVLSAIHIGFIAGIFSTLVNLCLLVLGIMGIVYAAQGKAKELPIIGKIKILK